MVYSLQGNAAKDHVSGKSKIILDTFCVLTLLHDALECQVISISNPKILIQMLFNGL